ncbi:hypothetical protein [Gluconobacter albidus]|uniref:Uncharacterized protein n=1 Tax=Gluconobacter albidus TaxID=318683 RepID=A0ABQ5WX54_9PROT|nr:hypothetical protein [Gluconobacter albidus]GBQ92626.1 hypothetical protein AA3250_2625 [Gluconobacter albidus NBRC 3250]GLQ68082.1 hypothetical protein GCM10007866_05300 [Gluconobacter albidus]
MTYKSLNKQINVIPAVVSTAVHITPPHITKIINESSYATFDSLINGIVYGGYHDDNINDIALYYAMKTYGDSIPKPTQTQIDSYKNKRVVEFATNTFKFKNTPFICDDEQQYKTRCILMFWNYKFSSMYPNDVFLNMVDYQTNQFVRSKSKTVFGQNRTICDVLRVFFDNHVPGMDGDYLTHMKHVPQIMDTFSTNPDQFWRIRAAMYGSNKIRDVLVHDKHCDVRKAVARYGNDSHRQKLSSDRAKSVQCVVYQTTTDEQLRDLIFQNQKITRSNQTFIQTVIQYGTNDKHIAKCKLFEK